ncbi:NACHT domain-containing protein [Streptomyces mesophilus]|uniref:NACHT domain-containing protein n=1 Tax=Streptomyces mesophilus TaxID=1775132 RepID=UPI00332E784B
MLELVAAKVAGAVLGAATSAAVRATMPTPGAGLARTPRRRLRFSKPTTVEQRDVEHLANHVAKKLQNYVDREFPGISENETSAVMLLVGDSFAASRVDIWDVDLDAEAYAREVMGQASRLRRNARLSEDADVYFEVLIHHTSLHVVQFITSWPTFCARADVEQLQRLRSVTTTLERVHEKMGADLRTQDLDFEQNYTALIIDALDRMEIFGLDLAERSRRSYNLTSAYITLSVAPASQVTQIEDGLFGAAITPGVESESARPRSGGALGMRAETAISSYKRILLRGDAGSGKTTLLRWLSVNSARRSLAGELNEWNTLVPFILPLRRFANGELPSPSRFFPEVGTHLAEEMPEKWVHRVLRAGRGLVLIDGVDELPSEQRDSARNWLRELLRTYPAAHYVVTSRPAAAETDWLAQDGFVALDMLPMSQKDVESFIRHWHDAAREIEADQKEIDTLNQGQRDLVASVREERQLRRLASNPLLCALLCTLNRDRHSQLPKDRMELYRAALDMLLLRRDRERKINYPEPSNLTDSQKKSILGSFAHWLIRNGLSDAAEEQAVRQVGFSLQTMPSVTSGEYDIFDYLLVRSGCLRRPVEGRIDFVHRTFQEFLAAARIVEIDDLENLLLNAHLDQWHEVVVMAVGHARPRERSMILNRLLDRGDREPEHRSRLHLLAAACLETAGECDPEVYEKVKDSTARLIPPRRMSDAKDLASAGEMVIPLIPERRLPAGEAAATIRMAATVGGDAALSLIARYARDERVTVRRELERAWQYFETDEYAKKILAQAPESWTKLSIALPEMLNSLRYLPSLRSLDVFCPTENLDWLPESRQLRELILRRSVHKFDYEDLLKCPALESVILNLGHAEGDFTSLGGLTSLKRLLAILGNSGNLTNFPSLPELVDLYLVGVPRFDFGWLPSATPKLASLTIETDHDVNFASIKELPDLVALNVWNPGDHHAHVVSTLPTLRTLGIRGDNLDFRRAADFLSPNLRAFNWTPYRPTATEIDLEPFLDREDLRMQINTYDGIRLIGLDDPRVEAETTDRNQDGTVTYWIWVNPKPTRQH